MWAGGKRKRETRESTTLGAKGSVRCKERGAGEGRSEGRESRGSGDDTIKRVEGGGTNKRAKGEAQPTVISCWVARGASK